MESLWLSSSSIQARHTILTPGRRRKPFRERPSLWSSIRSRSLPTKLDEDLVDNEIAIDVEDLCLEIFTERGEIPILKSCSMKIPKGEFWMLLGPNGCGKSTILKALAGILRSSHGNVLVQGPRSFVFQNPDHQVVMPTAEADVAFGLGCLNLPEDEVKERVFKSLEVVGMSAYAQEFEGDFLTSRFSLSSNSFTAPVDTYEAT